MVEIIRNKWCDDLEELLACELCMILPMSPIYQCTQGHHVCENCKIQLTICPSCGQTWSSGRNRLAEELCAKLELMKESLLDPDKELNKLLIPDKVSIASQTDGTDACTSGKKIQTSPAGPYPCRIGACNTYRYFDVLMKHLATDHPNQFVELKQDGNVFQYIWTIEYAEQMKFDKAIRVTDMGTYFLKLSTDVFGNFTGFVMMVHNATVSAQYSYQLEVSCCSEHKCLTYTGEVITCRHFMGTAPDKCMQIKRGEMQRLTEHEKELKCTVLLVKKSSPEELVATSRPQGQKKKKNKKSTNSVRSSAESKQSEPLPSLDVPGCSNTLTQLRTVSTSQEAVNHPSSSTSTQGPRQNGNLGNAHFLVEHTEYNSDTD